VIQPLSVECARDVRVLYVRYAEGPFSYTKAVDQEGEILADFASDGRVLGIECLWMAPDLRAALVAFAAQHELVLPSEIDTFAA
jgi:uncharacterized protein YuzE